VTDEARLAKAESTQLGLVLLVVSIFSFWSGSGSLGSAVIFNVNLR